MYDPAIGRWFGVDGLSELVFDQNPFNFNFNNPLRFIDMDGMRSWPVNSKYNNSQRHVSSSFQTQHRPKHNGVDIGFRLGTGNAGAPILSTHDGTVTRVATIAEGDTNAGGNRIVVTSEDGRVSTSYMHLEGLVDDITLGSSVNEGQQIGTMGGSGKGKDSEYVPHLHYEIRVDGELQNPEDGNGSLIDPQELITPMTFGGVIDPVEIEVPGKAPMTLQFRLPELNIGYRYK